ncbi:MAG: hypothetical protein AAFP90_21050 [Planctomycetota bacterium]
MRLHLANHGLTLKGDQTPAYWQQNLSAVRGTTAIADNQRAIVTPFTILVDSAEQQPFTFQGMRADGQDAERPYIVRTRQAHLGVSHGDYSVLGLEGEVHIERKSMDDVIGTVLGWGSRREQFQQTLSRLAEMPSSAVIVECTFGAAIEAMHSRGKKSAAENKRIFHRQVMAWQDDYRVPWLFCDNRRLAEISTFQWLRRQWKHAQKAKKRAALDAAKADQHLSKSGL